MTFLRWLTPKPRVRAPRRSGEFRPGVVLNRTYRILKPLATGGVGRVFLASHERLPGRVAVKVLKRSLVGDRDSLKRFRNEAEILAGLSHPNIVQVLDFNITEGGIPYLAMELVKGMELRECINQQPSSLRTPEWVANVVRQAASALRVAHLRGIVHRDIKPENIMVTKVDGKLDFVKVLDFGVSNIQSTGGSRPANDPRKVEPIVGTPGYMPPEQLQTADVDDRADQFALAAVTYELLTGQAPFSAPNEGALLWKIINDDPPSMAQLVSWPSADVEAVIRKGLAKHRDDRYADILEFARALEKAVAAIRTIVVASALVSPIPQPLAANDSGPLAARLPSLEDLGDVGLSYLW